MPVAAPSILNASTYLFVPLHVQHSAGVAGLKGMLLLAEEGINLVLAGAPQALRAWLAALREDRRFAALDVEESWSQTPPFRHLRAKIKPEIIRMNQPTVRPQAGGAPAVDANTLARGLQAGHCDAGQPLVLPDTRNAFEVDAGASRGATDRRLARFSDFPAALAAHRSVLAGKTVVSDCTGGTRCEKAALWMASAGVDNVLQLDGRILRYLHATAAQQAPGRHGACVVFDARGALDPQLAPTPSATA